MFDQVLDAALEKAGSSKILALEIEISAPDLSKFRAGELGLKINKLHRLIKYSGLKIGPADKEQDRKSVV